MRIVHALLGLGVVASAVSAQETTPASVFARWEMLDPGGRAMPYLGRDSLFLSDGLALMPEVAFTDGVIAFDVAMHGQPGFAGVVFRGQSPTDYELVYLRTHRSRQWDALQYTPVFGLQEAWQLYTGAGYNGVAELPLNRWVHVEMVVEGATARVHIDHATQPQLTVTDLKRPRASGRVGLWGRSGAAHFSNVTVTASPATPAPTVRPTVPLSGIITRWALGPVEASPAEAPVRLPAVARWEAIEAEPNGILNIARFRTAAPGTTGQSNRVLARTILRTAAARTVRLAFGYSDALTIFVNGRARFSGRNAYLERDGSSLGTMTLGPDVLHLDLTAGANELVFAVSERFGGWGLAARLLDTEGVVVE
jgi:hypothetical protein